MLYEHELIDKLTVQTNKEDNNKQKLGGGGGGGKKKSKKRKKRRKSEEKHDELWNVWTTVVLESINIHV